MVTRGATKLLSPVPLSCSPMDYTPPPPLSRGFARLEYWSGLPFSSLGDLPRSEIKPVSPALAGKFFTTDLPGKSPKPCNPRYNSIKS